ncbi:B12-binding domain-containing radical SAM protein [Haloimpatiens sp. FM7330]|uniref:B12-binding domain-containing radical SAM protein n=1 Tax=Haloimpatiens sp. FM7330 TaxID=3298610 RepID=UPI00363AAA08
MKVLLVAINSKFIHSNLAVRYLKSYTRGLDYECEIVEFSINDLKDKIVEEIINKKPDIVGFSCYIWNIEYVKKISKLLKLVDVNIQIFAGGPEVSFDCEKFLLENSVDYIIQGEGEETYREFIENKIKENVSKNLKNENIDEVQNIKGIYSKYKGKIFYGGIREIMDMNNIVFPYNKDDNLDNKIVYYEASRGCPFGCKYCLSSVDRKVRFLNIERVKKELQFFINKKVKLIKFVDRTFNCNPKFANEIWKFLINQKEDIRTTFHFEISADILTEEQIEMLAKSQNGRLQFEVGVQTTNNEILKNINRHVNFHSIKTKIEEVEKVRNVKQHLDLIAGLPGEDIKSFKKSFNEVYSIKPEEIQLGFLKLLKGSPMIREASEWGMVYSPYPPYEILKTKDISYEELRMLKKVEKMVDKYYNTNKFNNILKYFELLYKKPFDFYYDLAMFFERKGYFNRNISSADYYKVFLEFNFEELKKNNEELKEIIKFDYLRFNKKKWLPQFLYRESDKKLEKKVKKVIRDKKIIICKNIHIEKFNIDIYKFINTGIILKGSTYIAFNEENNSEYKDITIIWEKLISEIEEK